MRTLTVLLGLVLFLPAQSLARDGGPGPAKPLRPRPGMTDAMLYEKAMTLQAQMWWHISPEGLLVYRHTRGANAAQLSHEAINRADAAIWTGCHAAAQACRWSVTGDPDALIQVRALARGLDNLSRVTGTHGRLARNVGVPLPGSKPADFEQPVEASPAGNGWLSRIDVSRDQLAGVILGWAMIGKFCVGIPDLQKKARDQMMLIAWELHRSKMWMRDRHGNKTKYGELRHTVPHMPLMKFGAWAAIGLAAVIVAADLNPSNAKLQDLVVEYDKKGWDGALPHQLTWISSLVNASDVNMVTLGLLCIATSKRSKEREHAKTGMKQLRKATVGWWNAGTSACFLLGGHPHRRDLVDEIRVTLHRMPDGEYPRTLVRQFKRRAVAPIDQRQRSAWHWTNNVRWFHIWKPGGTLDPEVYYTGADFLFAYWIARVAGALQPTSGPGANPRGHRCPVNYPPWMPESKSPPK